MAAKRVQAGREPVPRYDYECESCHHVFELKQSFSSEPVAECPVCGSTSRRVIHSVPVVFKGSGFYVNDYGKGKSGRPAKESDSESKKDTKAESKTKESPKAKSESKKEPAAAKSKAD